MYVCIYMYIYIYVYIEVPCATPGRGALGESDSGVSACWSSRNTSPANSRSMNSCN